MNFNYRGVILDVDADFQGTEEWYEQVARSRPPRDQPWYHVLVENASYTTYVAERHLESDAENGPVEHPAIEELFDQYLDGTYIRNNTLN